MKKRILESTRITTFRLDNSSTRFSSALAKPHCSLAVA
jgi:hypothetical protein